MSTHEPAAQTTVEPTTDEPTITRHVEPESQGAATYFRCACGREAMRERDLRSEAHKDECAARGGR